MTGYSYRKNRTMTLSIPSLTHHLESLVTRENYTLLGAAELLNATLETAAVVARARFPEVAPGTPEFRELTLSVNSLLLGVMGDASEALELNETGGDDDLGDPDPVG